MCGWGWSGTRWGVVGNGWGLVGYGWGWGVVMAIVLALFLMAVIVVVAAPVLFLVRGGNQYKRPSSEVTGPDTTFAQPFARGEIDKDE
jgi:uncharacterized membrane protein